MQTRGQELHLLTRPSALARTQAASVRSALEAAGHSVTVETVESDGDRVDELIDEFGQTGAFVRELDERVIAGEADAAVHSLKDVPTDVPEELVIAGVPERGPAGDVLVTTAIEGVDGAAGLEDLPEHATVGTGSRRRRAQVLAAREDCAIAPIRGNVDTRVEKLIAGPLQDRRAEIRAAAGDDGDETSGEDLDAWLESRSPLERDALDRDLDRRYGALVLARAGLDRLTLAAPITVTDLPTESFVPAPCQGALGVSAREDGPVAAINDAVDHAPTRVATTVERTVLAALGGGCITPIGVHATLRGEVVQARVRVIGPDGEEVAAARDLPVASHADAARSFASDLVERGASDLVEASEGAS
ncbi:hydroxymethylbilane synthase [Halococcoides cellulosivorans]|uniref:Probable porphobilinogen deaminase n=1 Tax=Halococcoides cellulosivorans TaxID=1679096 RepID=A0A2R4WYK8_9EURY|nr:hydroxymethylbilane synthase [Halococcoides cellulosivorans]AWB26615.1 hydroxymethylbilane synthase [Halococcoides cellulosivorans]